MAAQLGVPVEYVAHNNSGQIADAAGKGAWDVTFLPRDPEREGTYVVRSERRGGRTPPTS